ncbi:MAG TPA: hypothetical protein VFB66_19095 [Tepidisphaeraceae bacterium]|nr:hypothetical protein [Tepidisphaeraceae bacterium]
MNHRTLVTGFLAFEGFEVNPSALLARSSGRPHELIEVAFDAVEEFLDRLAVAAPDYDSVLMLGVRGGGTRIEVERVARNHVGASPDVRGQVIGPAPIEPAGPDALYGTLFPDDLHWPASHDAGCYLCNYVYYRALRRLPPTIRVGFGHVPPLNVVPLHEQQRDLSRLLELIDSAGFPATIARA